MRALVAGIVVFVTLAVSPPVAYAKVANTSLANLATAAEFIGIVRVDRVGGGAPFLRRPRATATIVESWKGRASGRVSFVASPTWICDISGAIAGETAVIFMVGKSLAHAGRGRMPIFVRDGRQLAAIWPEVRLPVAVPTEGGPEPEYKFIRGVPVADLRAAVALALEQEAPTEYGAAAEQRDEADEARAR